MYLISRAHTHSRAHLHNRTQNEVQDASGSRRIVSQGISGDSFNNVAKLEAADSPEAH